MVRIARTCALVLAVACGGTTTSGSSDEDAGAGNEPNGGASGQGGSGDAGASNGGTSGSYGGDFGGVGGGIGGRSTGGVGGDVAGRASGGTAGDGAASGNAGTDVRGGSAGKGGDAGSLGVGGNTADPRCPTREPALRMACDYPGLRCPYDQRGCLCTNFQGMYCYAASASCGAPSGMGGTPAAIVAGLPIHECTCLPQDPQAPLQGWSCPVPPP